MLSADQDEASQHQSKHSIELEWRIAHDYFDADVDAVKLRRKDIYHDLRTSDLVSMKHSYLRTPQGILKMAGPKDYLGVGGYGRVKFAENKQGDQFAVKIICRPVWSITVETEFDVAFDLGVVVAQLDRADKNYIVYKYLGQELSIYLQQTDLGHENKYNLAIDLACALDELHDGRLSKTEQRYAHLDIKPENVTIDREGKIHLIDYGSARLLEDKNSKLQGTQSFVPVDYDRCSNQQLDVFALLRTLFLPSRFESPTYEKGKTWPGVRMSDSVWIFDDFMVRKNACLNQLLDTTSSSVRESKAEAYTAIQIAAYLVLCQIDNDADQVDVFLHDFSTLLKNTYACREFVSCYRKALREDSDLQYDSDALAQHCLLWKNAVKSDEQVHSDAVYCV